MAPVETTRRSFLTSLGAVASTGLISGRANAQVAMPRIRRNVNTLGPKIDSLMAGVRYMRSLPLSDPRSWSYQAGIHGTVTPTANPLFNNCKHGSILFLAWHRGYLYYFERILRWASGDPNLDLPYWDWSTSPAVPAPFRMPANPSNPLYEPRRALNDGSSLPAELVVDNLNEALASLEFSGPTEDGFTWSLENSPHGTVHTYVGGVGGVMSRVPTAANDPIFWMHHCNIDRLWDIWLNLGGGRANPTDSTFLETRFSYADENGLLRPHRVRDILSSSQLGYRYDIVPNPAPVGSAPILMAAAPPNAEPSPPPTPVASSAAEGQQPTPSKPLGLQTETVKLKALPIRPQAAPPGVPGTSTPSRILLRVEGIAFDEIPDFSYGVYLNVPEGQQPSERTRDHLVGTLNFFGKDTGHAGGPHGHGGEKVFSQTFDVTKMVERLRKKGFWGGNAAPRVDLRPLLTVAPKGAEAAVHQRAEASVKRANVRYKGVHLLEVP